MKNKEARNILEDILSDTTWIDLQEVLIRSHYDDNSNEFLTVYCNGNGFIEYGILHSKDKHITIDADDTIKAEEQIDIRCKELN